MTRPTRTATPPPPLIVGLPVADARRIAALATARGITVDAVIAEAIADYLARPVARRDAASHAS